MGIRDLRLGCWEQVYGDDEVTAQKQRAHALYEVCRAGLIRYSLFVGQQVKQI